MPIRPKLDVRFKKSYNLLSREKLNDVFHALEADAELSASNLASKFNLPPRTARRLYHEWQETRTTDDFHVKHHSGRRQKDFSLLHAKIGAQGFVFFLFSFLLFFFLSTLLVQGFVFNKALSVAL